MSGFKGKSLKGCKKTQFKKGQSGNPKGSSMLGRARRKLRKLTSDDICEVGSLILDGTKGDLQALVNAPDTNILKTWMGSLIVTSIKKGDAHTFSILMDRIVGKPKEHITLAGDEKKPLKVMTTEEKLARIEELRAKRIDMHQHTIEDDLPDAPEV